MFRESCENAVALGCDTLMSAPGQVQGPIKDAIKFLKDAGDIAAEYKLKLAIEFNSQHDVLNSLAVLTELIEGANKPNCGYLIDAYHFTRSGAGGRGFESVPADKIYCFQYSRSVAQSGHRRAPADRPAAARQGRRQMARDARAPGRKRLHRLSLLRGAQSRAMGALALRRRARGRRAHEANYCGTLSRAIKVEGLIMAEELPLFLGLNDKTITDIPKTVEKQRYMMSVAPKAANPGKWVEQPRMPIPTGEHAVIECQGKIHSIAGYAKHRVDQNFHQVYDPASKTWSLKAPFPHPCNHVAGVSIGTKIYTFGGFVEQNRCPHSKCFVYDTTTDQWAPIAPISRPRGAVSAIVLDGKIHLLGGRDVRSVEWHEVYDPETNKYSDRASMRGSTGTQPFVGQRDHMGVAVVDGKIHAIAGRMDSYDFNTSLNAVYDPKTDAWSFRAPLPTARSGPSCVYIGGKIVVFGGEATGRVFGTNEIYDPKTDAWEAGTPMAIPRHGLHGATCAVIGNMVHVPGGGPVPGGQVQGAYHDAFTFG